MQLQTNQLIKNILNQLAVEKSMFASILCDLLVFEQIIVKKVCKKFVN